MREGRWFLWNFFQKRPHPAEAENVSVGAIVRLLKARHIDDEEEKAEELPAERSDEAHNRPNR